VVPEEPIPFEVLISHQLQQFELDEGFREQPRNPEQMAEFVAIVSEFLADILQFEPSRNAQLSLDPCDPKQVTPEQLHVLQLMDAVGLLDAEDVPEIGEALKTLQPYILLKSSEQLFELWANHRDAGDNTENVDDQDAETLDLDHSRPLDVHVWSDHPEVNTFVDAIYQEHFEDGNANIRKKHLKVVLLDLYVAWSNDPDLKIAYSRSPNAYRADSRYNALHISRTTIQTVDRLREVGLIHHHDGFHDRRRGVGRLSRMWPKDALIGMFQDARFGPLDIQYPEDRECIILRNEDKDDIEYEDTDDTNRMREFLSAYNDLLKRTFIDIPTLRETFIYLGETNQGRQKRLYVNQRDKFVRRIFNRSSFDKGGRFFGGWWQRCPKERRGRIFINDRATSEIDYSGLHIVMLYAQEGIDYWEEVGADPYTIDTPEFLESAEQARSVCKQLLLVAVNAADERSAFQAFRGEAETGTPEKSLTNNQLGLILTALRDKHQPIAHRLASDAVST
jgi:hypothetical protein